jgi:hypothetical protein
MDTEKTRMEMGKTTPRKFRSLPKKPFSHYRPTATFGKRLATKTALFYFAGCSPGDIIQSIM